MPDRTRHRQPRWVRTIEIAAVIALLLLGAHAAAMSWLGGSIGHLF